MRKERAKAFKKNGIRTANPASILEQSDIGKIKNYFLKTSFRNYTIFYLNLNIGLRASDLLSLRCSDVFDEKWRPVDELFIREQKTGKLREIYINKTARELLRDYRKKYINLLTYDGYLFPSRKQNQGEGHLTITSFDRILREAAHKLHLQRKYNLSSHSLRKTFGTILYERGTSLEVIQQMFNHGSPKTTLLYIDIHKKEIKKGYKNLRI